MRNIPLIFLAVVLLALMLRLPYFPQSKQVTIIPEPEPVNQKAFTGRMVMPSLNDIYVLDNSAGRDIRQIEKFLQGRAAGLHYLASRHFKAVSKAKGAKGHVSSQNVLMGIRLTLDSLGHFAPQIMFSNVDDEEFKSLVCEHIQAYWRYPRSNGGRLELWAPFVWKRNY